VDHLHRAILRFVSVLTTLLLNALLIKPR